MQSEQSLNPRAAVFVPQSLLQQTGSAGHGQSGRSRSAQSSVSGNTNVVSDCHGSSFRELPDEVSLLCLSSSLDRRAYIAESATVMPLCALRRLSWSSLHTWTLLQRPTVHAFLRGFYRLSSVHHSALPSHKTGRQTRLVYTSASVGSLRALSAAFLVRRGCSPAELPGCAASAAVPFCCCCQQTVP